MSSDTRRHGHARSRTRRPGGRLVAAAVAAVAIASSAIADVQRQVEQVIASTPLGGARVGVSLVDLQSGKTLAAVDAARPYVPASNMKLLTTGAALHVLGEDFVFRTELLADGDRLIIRGSGDPALADPDLLAATGSPLDSEGVLRALAEAARRLDATPVSELVVDDRVFDRQFVHEGWPTDQLDKHYCAGVSGFNLHRNVLDFYLAPGPDGPGSAPVFALEPEMPWVGREVVNRARTVGEGENVLGVLRGMSENSFTLIGKVRRRSLLPARVSVHEIPSFWGGLLAERLSGTGLSFGGEARARVRLAEADESFEGATTLAVVTTPLLDIARMCNFDSVNLYAEAMLKRLGHEITGESGSWANGSAVVRMVVSERLGGDAATRVAISDGSGLSRDNAIPPEVMTRWLASLLSDQEIGDAFVSSLPMQGEGTLSKRFSRFRVANEVRGKSGSINHVRTLSGYVIDRTTGRTVAFSVMVNDLPLEAGMSIRARDLHERVVQVADRWLTEQREASLASSRSPEREQTRDRASAASLGSAQPDPSR